MAWVVNSEQIERRIARLEDQVALVRAQLERLAAVIEEDRTDARVATALTEQLAKVTAHLVELRREGFNPPPTPPPAENGGPKLPSVVIDALRQVLEPGTAEYEQQEHRAAVELDAGHDPVDVRKRILEGEPFRW